MAKIDNISLKQIQGALLDAFSTSEQLRQLARLELNENLEEITGEDNLRSQVFELLLWAERTNHIFELVAGALAQNPNSAALQELSSRLANQQSKLLVKPADPSQRDIPFIGPVPFDSDSADLFFGRTEEISQLSQRLQTRSVPLLVINGLSGSGKTSLLRAGLVPHLIGKGIPAIYASILDSPYSDLLHAIERSTGALAHSRSKDCIAALDQYITNEQASMLVLIVDQLERCFTYRPSEQEHTDFWRAIARVVRGDTSCPVKLVLSVRSDWLYACQTISPSPVDVPIFDYLFLVERLTSAQARLALTGPLDTFHVAYDDVVIDQIVKDLCSDKGFVNPPQLQVVGNAVYEYAGRKHTDPNALRLTLEDYTALQGASSILRQHLLRILKLLGPRESAGWQILLHLVGSEDIRVSCSEDEMRGNLSEEVFQPVVQSLVKYAVIVRDISSADGHPVYTLTHDYLVGEIKQHFEFDSRLQALRLSQHYLATGLEDNRRAEIAHAEFLPLEHERYNHIWRHYPDLNGINLAATRFLVLSALWYGEPSFASWLERLQGEDLRDTTATLRTICMQQLAKGNERPVAAVKAAVKGGVSLEVLTALKSSLLGAFVPPTATDATQEGAAVTTVDCHGIRGPLASAIWSMRRVLKPADIITILPALAQNWLQTNRTALLSAATSIALFVLILAAILFVQDRLAGHWMRGMPLHGGPVNSFAIDQSADPRLYVATDTGRATGQATSIFAGDLSDTQWLAMAQSIGAEPIQDLVVAGPSSDPTIYAAIRGRGIYRRQGGSDEWQFVNRGLNSYDISDVAVDPEDPKHLYIATNNFSGVFESRDAGGSWTDISAENLFGVSTTVISFSRAESSTKERSTDWVVVGTADGRIFRKQRNIDEEWQPVAAYPGTGAIMTIAWDPLPGSFLMAGTATGKLLLSFDAGASWSFLPEPPNVYAIVSVAVTPGEPDQVSLVAYGVGGYTIWRSMDDAYTWELDPTAQFSREFMRLIVGPPSSGLLFAYGGPGLFVFGDHGQSWRWVSNVDAPLAAVNSVEVSPLHGGPTYATLIGSVFTTLDPRHGSWIRGKGLPVLAIRVVAPDPQHSQVAYAGAYVPNRWSVYRTGDGGQTWVLTTKPDSIDERLIADASAVAMSDDASTLYVGTAGCGVIHSNDGGETWETFRRTDCDIRGGPIDISGIAVAPEDASTIYVASDGVMVYTSKDQGESWQSTRLPFTNRISAIAVDSKQPGRVYIVAGADGIWRSDNGAQDWRKVSKGLEDRALADIVVGHSANEVYVVATNGDAWLSTDAGEHWQSLRRDLAAKSGTSIALTNDGTIVLATQGSGIYFLHRGSLLGTDAGDGPLLTSAK